MANDTLAEDVEVTVKTATSFLRSSQIDEKARSFHFGALRALETRVTREIEDRSTSYVSRLNTMEQEQIAAKWQELDSLPSFIRISTEQKAQQQTFDRLRQVNGGKFPTNLSPIAYTIPLILIGVAEWYVNYSTFAAIFVPVVAIFATIVVAAIFATASHIHGAYIKQLSELIHPSIEYRKILGRQIALVLVTLFLIAAFGTIVSLRYIAIADQLGLAGADNGPFGRPSSWAVWSRLGPTIVINVLIWGLGTLYSWAAHERVPDIREYYRDLMRANRKLEKVRKPYVAAQKQIHAKFERERDMNQVVIKEYQTCLDRIGNTIEQFGTDSPSQPKAPGLRTLS
ncbi:hypothetical protein ACVIWV_007693 [Bradyrhizobium diazoefficiens]